MLNKIIEYGLYLLVFLLPVQTRWIIKAGEVNGGYAEYATYSLYATDILLILLLVLFIVYKFPISNFQFSNNFQLINFQTKLKSPIYWFIGGLLLMSAVSVFFAASKPLALYKLGWLILGAGLFWLVVKANYDRLMLIYAILAGMFLQAVLGVWQFLSQSTFANKWLGLALHKGGDLGASVIEAVGSDGVPERWLRAYGGLDHPNMLGGLMAIGILLIIREMIKINKIPNPNNQLPIKSQIPITNYQAFFKPINWVFLAVCTMALFFSFSRTAWLGVAIGLAIMMVLAVIGKNLKQQRSLAEIILVMGIVLFIIFSQYQNLAAARLAGEGRLENISTSERLVSYRESWRMIKNNWLFGAGLGNYTLVLSRQVPGEKSFYYQPAHNVYLLILSEIGVLGFAFFIGLIVYLIIFNFQFSPVKRVQAIFKQFSMNKFSKPSLEIRNCKLEIGKHGYANNLMFGIPVLVALIVIMSLDHWLFSLHFGALFFWLVLGVMASEKEKSLNPPSPL